MNKKNDPGAADWKGLAEEAVARSISKLARISSGQWALKDIEVAVSAEALRPAGDQDGALTLCREIPRLNATPAATNLAENLRGELLISFGRATDAADMYVAVERCLVTMWMLAPS